jgi:hypothetical protein
VNWDAIGASAELLGAIGVICSLVYLAVQIRAEARSRHAETGHVLGRTFGEIQQAVALDADLTEIFIKGIADFSILTAPEVSRFAGIMGAVFRSFEDCYLQWIDGHFDDRLWFGMKELVSDFVKSPGVQSWWRTRTHWYSKPFNEFIDGLIDAEPGQPLYRRYHAGKADQSK